MITVEEVTLLMMLSDVLKILLLLEPLRSSSQKYKYSDGQKLTKNLLLLPYIGNHLPEIVDSE